MKPEVFSRIAATAGEQIRMLMHDHKWKGGNNRSAQGPMKSKRE